MTINLWQFERLSVALVDSVSICPSPPCSWPLAATAWRKDDKQWLAGTRGRVIGHTRNRENHRQQHRENRSAHVATIRALHIPHQTLWCLIYLSLSHPLGWSLAFAYAKNCKYLWRICDCLIHLWVPHYVANLSTRHYTSKVKLRIETEIIQNSEQICITTFINTVLQSLFW